MFLPEYMKKSISVTNLREEAKQSGRELEKKVMKKRTGNQKNSNLSEMLIVWETLWKDVKDPI